MKDMSASAWRKPLAGLALTALLLNLIFRPRIEGDTESLIREAFNSLNCLRSGAFPGCRLAGQFPLFQAGPAMLLGAIGLPAGAIAHIFAYFSLVCFFASLAIFYRIARVGVLFYLSSFILVYSHSSFTEMAASTWILALVASCLTGQNPWYSAFFLLIAGLSKDTAAPFLLGLAALATAVRKLPARAYVRELIPPARAPGAARAVAAGF
jgi:hypothetical protein